jgi:hypothetical protein
MFLASRTPLVAGPVVVVSMPVVRLDSEQVFLVRELELVLGLEQVVTQRRQELLLRSAQ